jgi:hypothetical protein
MVFKQVRSLALEIRIGRRFTMLAVVGGLVLAFALVQMASASDELYRCSDGTFTNRVERQCAPYKSKGIVRVQTGHSDESKSTVKDDEPTQPFAEVQVYNGQAKSETEQR